MGLFARIMRNRLTFEFIITRCSEQSTNYLNKKDQKQWSDFMLKVSRLVSGSFFVTHYIRDLCPAVKLLQIDDDNG